MEGDRTNRALARIEAALARIEAGSLRLAGGLEDQELARLSARHQRLRHAVQSSLSQLDLLIEGTEE